MLAHHASALRRAVVAPAARRLASTSTTSSTAAAAQQQAAVTAGQLKEVAGQAAVQGKALAAQGANALSSLTASKYGQKLEPVVYYVKVLGHVARIVGQQTGTVWPNNFGTAQTGYSNFVAGFRNGAWKKLTIAEVGSLVFAGITVGGFFWVGEMIGRRSVVGYDVPGAHNHFGAH